MNCNCRDVLHDRPLNGPKTLSQRLSRFEWLGEGGAVAHIWNLAWLLRWSHRAAAGPQCVDDWPKHPVLRRLLPYMRRDASRTTASCEPGASGTDVLDPGAAVAASAAEATATAGNMAALAAAAAARPAAALAALPPQQPSRPPRPSSGGCSGVGARVAQLRAALEQCWAVRPPHPA